MSLVAAILAEHWAIHPRALQAIIRLAERKPDGTEAFALHGPEAARAWFASINATGPDEAARLAAVEALARRFGRPLEGTQRATIRDGVALVPVSGPIFPKANVLTDYSGATALSQFAVDLQAALENADVKAIVLDIDSPGGAVSGMAEAAALVRGARDGAKPIVAFAQGMAASGAYWIASGADEIVISPEALTGSIGVVMLASYQEQADQNGERFVEITSSNAPNKRPDVRTPDGIAEIRRRLDGVERVFLEDVAQGRGVSVETVIKEFGQGGVEVGAEAVRVGMADRIGSLEDVLAELSGGTWKRRPRRSATGSPSKELNAMTKDTSAPEATLDAATIKTKHPEAAAALIAEGAANERARILGIEERAAGLHGTAELVAAMKADGKTTPAEAADKLLAAEKAKKEKVRSELKESDPKPAAQTPAPSGEKPAMLEDPHAFAREIQALQDREAAAGRPISAAEAARRIKNGEAVAA